MLMSMMLRCVSSRCCWFACIVVFASPLCDHLHVKIRQRAREKEIVSEYPIQIFKHIRVDENKDSFVRSSATVLV